MAEEACTGDGWMHRHGDKPLLACLLVAVERGEHPLLVPGASRGEGRQPVPGNGWLARLGRHERNTREHEYARREISAVP